jgi:hypothetical protein
MDFLPTILAGLGPVSSDLPQLAGMSAPSLGGGFLSGITGALKSGGLLQALAGAGASQAAAPQQAQQLAQPHVLEALAASANRPLPSFNSVGLLQRAFQ